MLERGVRSMTPPSAWHTQVSSRPEAEGHLLPLGSAVTELSKRLCKHRKTKLSSMMYITVEQKGVGLGALNCKPRPSCCSRSLERNQTRLAESISAFEYIVAIQVALIIY